MKKSFISLILTIVMLSGIFTTVNASQDISDPISYKDVAVASVAVNSKADSLMAYSTDLEGNVYGPEDFCVDGKDSYIFNSNNDTIIKMVGGTVNNVIKLKDSKSIRIAADAGILYVLDSDLSISTFGSKGDLISVTPNQAIGSEAIENFTVIDGFLYTTAVVDGSEITYKFAADENGISYNKVETIPGLIFDSNTYYNDKLLADEGFSMGHSCRLEITDIPSGKSFPIVLTSNYWNAGAQLLNVDYDKQSVMIRLIEIANNPDYTYTCEETIRTVDFNGNLLAIRALDTQKKYIVMPTKVFGSQVYVLNNKSARVDIQKLDAPLSNSIGKFTSRLANIVEPIMDRFDDQANSLDPVVTRGLGPSISRATIMANALSYHLSFTWNVVADNVAAMTNYTKPRYFTAPSTVACMPYCWGGWDTTSSFLSGIASGSGSTRGRAGNINCPSSGWVGKTYGTDCSGYVSRCWALTAKESTNSLVNVSTAISASALQQGDLLNYAGSHSILFASVSSGNYTTYESTQTSSYDKVANLIRSVASLANDYVPRKYLNVI